MKMTENKIKKGHIRKKGRKEENRKGRHRRKDSRKVIKTIGDNRGKGRREQNRRGNMGTRKEKGDEKRGHEK